MLYKPKVNLGGMQDFESVCKLYDENMAALLACDKEARDAGRMVGRVLNHSFADGYAWYQVIKETPRTVTIKVCRGLGDDWVLPAWGEKATVAKATVLPLIKSRAAVERIFTTQAQST